MNRHTLSLLTLLLPLLPLSARQPDGVPPTGVSGVDLYRQNGILNVSFMMDVSSLDLKKNEQVTYTPVLTTADGSHRLALSPVVVSGRNAHISSERSRRRDGASLVLRHNGTAQTVSYSASEPYASWMDRATLYLAADRCGCGDLLSQESGEIAEFDNRPVSAADAVAVFVEPRVEKPKIRHEEGSAFVDFVVDRFDIRPSYRNNEAEIGKIISTIDLVKNDRNVEITNINIHGYASPEGAYAHNAWLAENRTKALTDYVRRLYDIPADMFTSSSTPEDWEGLRRLVAASDLAEREDILAVIDDGSLSPDAKEARLRACYPAARSFMLKQWYPSLRHSDYVISYVVRPFTAEEALEVMKTAPKQVSLHEMFWAAQSLGVNSSGYNEVIRLAVQTYPDEPAANYNAAVVSVNEGDYEAALRYMDKVPESAQAHNVRGVAHLNLGDLSSARRHFEAAVSQGMPDAAKNIEIIDRMEAVRRQNR